MIKFKIDVLQELKNRGYNTARIRKEGIFSESTLTKIRNNGTVTTATLDTICKLLKKQPGYILEYVEDINED